MDYKILPELQSYLLPLPEHDLRQLEESVLKYGFREAFILWDSPKHGVVLLDGHNRDKIKVKHGLETPETKLYSFESLDEVKIWMISNQIGRRNISDYRKIELLYMSHKLVTKTDTVSRKDRAKLATAAGCGENKVMHTLYVCKNAPDEILELARSGDISVNQAYQRVRVKETPKDPKEQADQLMSIIPSPLRKDQRMISIYTFFTVALIAKRKNYKELAKLWQDLYNVSEEVLNVDTIIKNYVRMREEISKHRNHIIEII